MRDANRQFLEQGQLRLQWSEIDGRAIAFDSGYVADNGVFVYQTAFDPRWAEISPGRLHLYASIAKAIDKGYAFVDLLRGDEPYKRHLRATPTPLLELRLTAQRVRPRIGYRLWQFRRQAKAGVRLLLKEKKIAHR